MNRPSSCCERGQLVSLSKPAPHTETDAAATGGAGVAGGFALDPVFDPDPTLSAFTTGAGASPRTVLIDSADQGFHVPMLDLAPIVRVAGAASTPEEWSADLGDGYAYRLSLFGARPDPNRTIFGVLSRLAMTGTASFCRAARRERGAR